jgi:GT2 family glycosyltransferase
MITIIYSTHKSESYNNKFKQHLLQSVGLNNVQILEYVNHNQYSLSQVYNSGITESIYDIVVCCHNDIKLEKNWGKKLINDFQKNQDYGIIGKAGTCYFSQSGVYWEKMHQTMVGQVYHQPENHTKKWINKYSVKSENLIQVVSIDGLFISFDKTKIKHKFDETIGKFHFYDHLFCIPNYLDNVKIGVTSSFDIIHESVGMPNKEFYESKDLFIHKWGKYLPLDLKPDKIIYSEIKEKPIKEQTKVAIIIPTKGNVDMLYNCVNSFFEHCNNSMFDIFIADTGSTDEEKKEIETKILTLGNVKLIEYDYYNFAKINNDVVKNHVASEYEYLLFCNNDIKILNNVIFGMLKIFKENKRAGTVGCRLHFEDNTIQHDGIIFTKREDESLMVTHANLGAYYSYTPGLKEVYGNTAALMMIRKNLFLSLGGFNENYTSCFEDVELNLSCVIKGFKNYYDGNLVAYHYESKTRGKTKESQEKEFYDFHQTLRPFLNENIKKIFK